MSRILEIIKSANTDSASENINESVDFYKANNADAKGRGVVQMSHFEVGKNKHAIRISVGKNSVELNMRSAESLAKALLSWVSYGKQFDEF